MTTTIRGPPDYARRWAYHRYQQDLISMSYLVQDAYKGHNPDHALSIDDIIQTVQRMRGHRFRSSTLRRMNEEHFKRFGYPLLEEEVADTHRVLYRLLPLSALDHSVDVIAARANYIVDVYKPHLRPPAPQAFSDETGDSGKQ